jgi:hypothetical protein
MILIVNAVTMLQNRHMFTLIPILILCSYYYGSRLLSYISFIRKKPFSYIIYVCLLLVFSSIFAQGIVSRWVPGWIYSINNLISDVKAKNLRIMEFQDDSHASMKGSYENIVGYLKECDGIMTLESTFFGAFMKYPYEKIYDTMEIPPFGKYGDGSYSGLNPDRVNCVFVSRDMVFEIGYATNLQMRVQNHIAPYVDYLLSQGAKGYDIENYGRVFIFPKKT